MNRFSHLSQDELDRLIAQEENKMRRGPVNSQIAPDALNKKIQRSKFNPANSFLKGATDSLTLGFAPKIQGAVLAPILKYARPDLFEDQSLGDIYEEGRDTSRMFADESAEDNPLANLFGGLLGGAALPFPAKNLKEGAGLGALYGGAYGIGSNDESMSDKILSGLAGAATGAPFGAAGTLVGRLFNKSGGPAPEQKELLDISKELGIPLTYGELSGKPGELLREEAALKGRMGSKNQRNVSQFKDLQKANIAEAASNLRNNIGNGEFNTKGTSAREAISNLQEKALAERAKYGEAYKEAKQGLNTISKDNFGKFYEDTHNSLLEDVITRDNAPKAFGELDSLKTVFSNSKNKDVNIKQLESWRQGLNQTYKSALNSGDEKTAFALNKIKNNFDGFMDNSIEKALENGDVNALNKFKEARGLASEWYQKYGANNPKDFGKKFIGDMVNRARVGDESLTDEMIVNKIFGTSEIGFKPESATIVKELKQLLPKEDFDKIKLEGSQKLLSPLIGENPSAARYQTNLKQFLNSNQSLAKELFSKDELKQLTNLGKISETALTRKKSLINPSGTAEVVLDELQKWAPGGSFIRNAFNKIELDQGKIASKINKGERIEKEPNSIIKSLTSNAQNKLISAENVKPEKNKNEELNNNIQNPTQFQNQFKDISDDELNKLIAAEEQKRSLNTKQNNDTNNIDSTQNLKTEKPQLEYSDLLNKISYVESGNNPRARSRTSSASGLYQFTDSTWKNMVNKYGQQYGITLKDKNNPEAQRVMAQKLLEDNKQYLQTNLGRKPTAGELYLAHFMGPQGAYKLISSNPNQVAARIFPQQAKANRSIFFNKNNKPRTIEQVYDLITTKV